MAKKKREQATSRMPGGAQQYARPGSSSSRQSPIARRMDTIGTAMDAVRRTPRTLENAADRDAKQRMLLQAMIDESDTAQNARMMERQTTAEDRANRRKEGGAMKSKKTLAPAASKRPTPRPDDLADGAAIARGNRASKREAGMKAGGKVKKMRAGGGSMSSASLRERILEDSLARDRNIGRTYADRGTVGDRKAKEEVDREIREYAKDSDLIGTYGRDAPNARSFNTRRAAGGAVKKMQAGGKCRGMGKATRGGNFSRG